MNQINLNDPNVASIREKYKAEFYVIWLLGNQCTYKCSYCPSIFHDGSAKYQPTDVIQNVMKNLPKCNITFTGGEPTFHPDFEKIVLEKPDIVDISVISNASRPLAFWERIASKLRLVTLTYHMEYAIHDRFVSIAELVYKTHKKMGSINLIMLPNRWEECVQVYERLIEKGFRVVLKPLVENFGVGATQTVKEYTQDQLNWISLKNKSSYKLISVIGQNNEVIYETTPAELISLNQVNFEGWTCYTNTQCLCIDMIGDVYDTSCTQRTKVGNIYDGFTISTEPLICNQKFCWCYSDIIPKKVK